MSPENNSTTKPTLKRKMMRHSLGRSEARLSEAATQAATLNGQSRPFANNVPTQPMFKEEQQSMRQKSPLISVSVESEEKTEGNIAATNHMVSRLIQQDTDQSCKNKEKKGYSHRYIEHSNSWDCHIAPNVPIPEAVTEHYQRMQRQKAPEKVNFIQGMLPQVGFLYYAVEDTVFFVDAEVSKVRECVSLRLESRGRMFAVYGVQCIKLGQPYIRGQKNVILVLMPYLAEFYEYDIIGSSGHSTRQLSLVSLNLKVPLPQIAPKRLRQAASGRLYCADHQGSLCQLDIEESLLSCMGKEMVMRRYQGALKAFWHHSVKMVSLNLVRFAKSVKNYTKNLFSGPVSRSDLVLDDQRGLAIVSVSRLGADGDKVVVVDQQIRVYDMTSCGLMYLLSGEDVQGQTSSIEQITGVFKMEPGLNSNYNLMITFSQGKRVFMDLGRQSLNKYVVYKAPVLSKRSQNKKASELQPLRAHATIFQESYLARLVTTQAESGLMVMAEHSDRQESVSYVKIADQRTNEHYLHERQLKAVSDNKTIMLDNQKSGARIEQMSEKVKQVYYQPKQLYYCTDSAYMRLTLLRPIDGFLSVFLGFGHNFNQMLSALQRYTHLSMQGPFSAREVIAMASQILNDREGVYFTNERVVSELRKKVDLRGQREFSFNSRTSLQVIFADQLRPEERQRLIDLMERVASQQGKRRHVSQEEVLLQGILMYYSRVLRVVWQMSLNSISVNACRVIIEHMMAFKLRIKELTRDLRRQVSGFLQRGKQWAERVRELMMLVRTIPTLPEIPFSEAVTLSPQHLHPYMFWYITKQFRVESYEQLMRSFPWYANRSFEVGMKLWREVAQQKNQRTILKICRNYAQRPQYVLDYLRKFKGINEFMTNDTYPLHLGVKHSYDSLMSELDNVKSTLRDKEMKLEEAALLLKVSSRTQEEKRVEEDRLRLLRARVKLQKLVVKQRDKLELHSRGIFNSVAFLLKNSNQNKDLAYDLNYQLFDGETLRLMIEQLGDRHLQLAHMYYFRVEDFQPAFRAVVEGNSDNSDSWQEAKNRIQKLMMFLLQESELHFDSRDVMEMLGICAESLVKREQLRIEMWLSRAVMRGELFWLLGFAAEMGVDPDSLYEWAVGWAKEHHETGPITNQSEGEVETDAEMEDKTHDRVLFMGACLYYLVKNFLPSREERLQNDLSIAALPQKFGEFKALFS